MSDMQEVGSVLLFVAWVITWISFTVYGDETRNWHPLKIWAICNLGVLWIAGMWLVIPS